MLDALPLILWLLALAALSLPETVATPTYIPVEVTDITKGEPHA
ncbi:MAG: hypothetical protein R2932_14730 [Caldilineaceae bacterium]